MGNMASSKSINWFLSITFLLSFSLAGIFILIFPEKDKIPFTIMGVLYMFMPTISVLITEKLIFKKEHIKGLAVNFNPNWWYMAAWPGMVIIVLLVLCVNCLWPGISFSPDMSGFIERMKDTLKPGDIERMNAQMKMIPIPFFWFTIIEVLVVGITINAVAAFGEELGWRGFLVREYKDLKFWDAALRIGIIWGVWHAPLIMMGHNYPQHPMIGVGMMVVFCILLSPLFLFVRLKTHSVIGTAIFHGTLNASAGLPLMYIAGGNDLTAGTTGFTGFITLALVNIIMLIYDRKFSKHPLTNCSLREAVKQ
jgi:uncharacterized protein